MHTDPELLGLLALGEPEGNGDDHRHVESCMQCAGELSELRQVVTLGRSVVDEPALSVPSHNVWARIRDELALAPIAEPPAHRSTFLTSTTFPSPTASASLSPVGASWSKASGTAVLATDNQGRRLLQVALQADLPTSGVRQAWLVHRHDPTLRQTLGILDGPHGLWTVEQSLDMRDFAILDISQQAAGETEHSGQTIVRGEFTLAG